MYTLKCLLILWDDNSCENVNRTMKGQSRALTGIYFMKLILSGSVGTDYIIKSTGSGENIK